MNRLLVLFLIFLIPHALWAKIEWANQHRFILAKDEPALIWVFNAKDDDAIPNEEFRFSWTLFDTKQLVLHTRFRDFPSQYILTLERGRKTMRQELIPDPVDRINGNVYVLLEFVEFNDEEKLATIDAFIQDRNGRIEVEFEDPKKRED